MEKTLQIRPPGVQKCGVKMWHIAVASGDLGVRHQLGKEVLGEMCFQTRPSRSATQVPHPDGPWHLVFLLPRKLEELELPTSVHSRLFTWGF